MATLATALEIEEARENHERASRELEVDSPELSVLLLRFYERRNRVVIDQPVFHGEEDGSKARGANGNLGTSRKKPTNGDRTVQWE